MTLTKQQRRRDTANRRKVNGTHHNKNEKHYVKAYWPYIPIFAVLGLGMLANVFIHRTDHDVLGYATNISAKVLLADTNAARSDSHHDALELNEELSKAAQAKANDMAKRDYWSHATPDGKQPWSFIDSTDYDYTAAGENLALGQTLTICHQGLMNSPGHRANILRPNYNRVGIGILDGGIHGLMVSQEFRN